MKKLLILLLFIVSCGTYVKQPVASHIVAVTMEGDTILVAIDKIRQNQYNTYYPVYNKPYYNHYYYYPTYQWRYPDNRGVSYAPKPRSGNGGSKTKGKSGGGSIKRNPPPVKPNLIKVK
tara:strand:- start:71 stop:427 length:357 start_codon:yes stop_codon:yes gene_type:complete